MTNNNSNTKLGYPVARHHGRDIMMTRTVFGYNNGSAKLLAFLFAFTGDNPYLDYIKKAEVLWSERLKVIAIPIFKLI